MHILDAANPVNFLVPCLYPQFVSDFLTVSSFYPTRTSFPDFGLHPFSTNSPVLLFLLGKM
jgi:hypothetical protein